MPRSVRYCCSTVDVPSGIEPCAGFPRIKAALLDLSLDTSPVEPLQCRVPLHGSQGAGMVQIRPAAVEAWITGDEFDPFALNLVTLSIQAEW